MSCHCVMRCLDVRWFWCQVIHELIVSSPHDVHRTAKLSKLAQKLGQLVNFEGPRQTTLMQRLLQDVLIYFALLLGKKYTCYSDRSAHMIQCAQNCTYVYNLYFSAHILCTFLDGSCFCELQITGKDAPDSQETVWQEFWRQRDAACKVHLCVHCF